MTTHSDLKRFDEFSSMKGQMNSYASVTGHEQINNGGYYKVKLNFVIIGFAVHNKAISDFW